jgi:hypothetical protein
MTKYWGVEVQIQVFLTAAVDGGKGSDSRPGRFNSRNKSNRYPLDRRLGGPQSRSGRGEAEKRSHLCP